MNESISSDYKKSILKAIEYHFPQARVILFGSRARSTNAHGSDIDIAIDAGEPIKLREMTRMRATIENLPISLEVDIVDVHNVPIELKKIIEAEGVIWKG